MDEKNTILIHQLPADVQVYIIDYIPFKTWPLAYQFLPSAFDQALTWKNCNLDKLDTVEDDIVELILRHVSKIKCMLWSCAVWNSSINSSIFIQKCVELENSPVKG